MDIKRGGSADSNLNFYDQVVRVEKGWRSKSLCSLFIAALPNEAGLPNEQISYRIKICFTCFRFYVQREIEYSYISTMGEVNVTALQNWEAYLEK